MQLLMFDFMVLCSMKCYALAQQQDVHVVEVVVITLHSMDAAFPMWGSP